VQPFILIARSGLLSRVPVGNVTTTGLSRISLLLHLLRGSEHCLHSGRQAKQNEQHHEYGKRSKEQIEPVSDAETDPKTGYKLYDHPPSELGV